MSLAYFDSRLLVSPLSLGRVWGPNLFAVPGQTTDTDIALVEDMVKSYIHDRRTMYVPT